MMRAKAAGIRRASANRLKPGDARSANAVESAREAGLRYISDHSVGITRHRKATGFAYRNAEGKPVKDADTLERVRRLVLPPAWTEVWICPDSRGHLQAVGSDARGRKQYRYHEQWRAIRDEDKFGRMMAFVAALPRIRRRVRRDLARRGLPREKVLAAVVRLLETTFIRVGNDEYARQNHSYGLTTLRDEHAKIRGSHVRFQFRGKSGVDHAIDFDDPRLARIVKKCQDLPGEELFAYVDDGKVCDVGSSDVNEYLREITGEGFTAKDFRTWAGTVLAATALRAFEAVDSQAGRKKNLLAAIDSVAKKLGNTRAVCRKCYIHPNVMNSYLDGSFLDNASEQASRMIKSSPHLRPDELQALTLLQRQLKATKPRRGAGKAA